MRNPIDLGIVYKHKNADLTECCHACFRPLVFVSNKFYCFLCGRKGKWDNKMDICYGYDLFRTDLQWLKQYRKFDFDRLDREYLK